jgi:hypothetical protein
MAADAQTENDAKAEAPKASGQSAGEETSRRERSTIEFPYTNLEDAEQAAKAIFQEAGTTELSMAQVASALGMSAASSCFRVRMSALKLFGLVEGDAQRVSLTDLGRAIAEPHTAQGARVDAFMRVPLYRAIVTKHDGHDLPPPAAFQREIVELGVAPKMADRARQVFDRSAKHAGFLKAGSDRFVTPIVQNRGKSEAEGAEREPEKRSGGGDGGDGLDHLDPVIRALISKIPAAGTQWPLEDQVQLLQMFAMAFHMTYKNKRPIKVSAEPEHQTTTPHGT